jgi:hypothetical protein
MAVAIVARRVRGWRSDSINQMLDLCSVTLGYVSPSTDLKPNSLGVLNRIYDSSQQKQKQHKIRRPELYKAAKERERQKMLADYQDYVSKYLVKFPDSEPVSYWVFSKKGLAPKFRKDPDLAVHLSYRSPELLKRLKHQVEEAQKLKKARMIF